MRDGLRECVCVWHVRNGNKRDAYVCSRERESFGDENRNGNRLQVSWCVWLSLLCWMSCELSNLHIVFLCINVKVQCELSVCEVMRVHEWSLVVTIEGGEHEEGTAKALSYHWDGQSPMRVQGLAVARANRQTQSPSCGLDRLSVGSRNPTPCSRMATWWM